MIIPASRLAGRPESTSTKARGPPVEAPRTTRPMESRQREAGARRHRRGCRRVAPIRRRLGRLANELADRFDLVQQKLGAAELAARRQCGCVDRVERPWPIASYTLSRCPLTVDVTTKIAQGDSLMI